MFVKCRKSIQLAPTFVREASTFGLQARGLQPQDTAEVNAKPFDEIPTPKGYPFLQNLPQLLSRDNIKHPDKFTARFRQELGDIFRMKMPGKGNDLVYIYTPQDSRTLLSNDGQMPIAPGFERVAQLRKEDLRHHFKVPGLLTQGEEWKEFRTAVQKDLLRPKSAMFYIEELNILTQEFCDHIQATADSNGETVDLNWSIQKFTLEASGLIFIATKFGVFQGDAESEELMSAVSNLIAELQFLFLMPPLLHRISSHRRKIVKSMDFVATTITKRIKEAIERDKKDGSLEGTLISKLIARCGADSPIPHVMAMEAISAGIDTTAHTATFLLFHLASNPEKQEILYQEICDITGKDGHITEGNIDKFKYLKACQQESMRMMPIAIGISRKTSVDMVLSGYRIPSGTTVLRYGLNNCEKHYPEADKFLPERWIRGCPQQSKADPFTNLPFGHGPRGCIGRRLARLELDMIAFQVVKRFRLEYRHEPIHVKFALIGHPDRECKIKLIPRN